MRSARHTALRNPLHILFDLVTVAGRRRRADTLPDIEERRGVPGLIHVGPVVSGGGRVVSQCHWSERSRMTMSHPGAPGVASTPAWLRQQAPASVSKLRYWSGRFNELETTSSARYPGVVFPVDASFRCCEALNAAPAPVGTSSVVAAGWETSLTWTVTKTSRPE